MSPYEFYDTLGQYTNQNQNNIFRVVGILFSLHSVKILQKVCIFFLKIYNIPNFKALHSMVFLLYRIHTIEEQSYWHVLEMECKSNKMGCPAMV
jgi:hypothetical protein